MFKRTKEVWTNDISKTDKNKQLNTTDAKQFTSTKSW